MAKTGSKLKPPSVQIILSITVLSAIIIALAFFFNGLRIGSVNIDPSNLTNAFTLFGFAFVPLVELYWKKPRFRLRLRSPADRAVAAIILPIAGATVIMSFLIGFGVDLPTIFRAFVSLLFILNALFIILLSRV